MAKKTIRETLATIQAFVVANPGASYWCEEILFRGEHADEELSGGKLKGAHVKIGCRYKSPDGEWHVKITDPLPVGDGINEIPTASVLDVVHVSQQKAIEGHVETCESLRKELEELRAAHAQTVKDLEAEHNEHRNTHLARIKLLQEENEKVKAEAAELKGQLSVANSPSRAEIRKAWKESAFPKPE